MIMFEHFELDAGALLGVRSCSTTVSCLTLVTLIWPSEMLVRFTGRYLKAFPLQLRRGMLTSPWGGCWLACWIEVNLLRRKHSERQCTEYPFCCVHASGNGILVHFF